MVKAHLLTVCMIMVVLGFASPAHAVDSPSSVKPAFSWDTNAAIGATNGTGSFIDVPVAPSAPPVLFPSIGGNDGCRQYTMAPVSGDPNISGAPAPCSF